ncbi:hypothetical protein ACQ4PT_056622 [Festuca glaucescens]
MEGGIRAWMAAAMCTVLLASSKGDGEGAIFNTMAASYQPFYTEVHTMITNEPLYRGHVLTAPLDPDTNQKETPPTTWVNVTIIGDGIYKAKMLLRDENLYFIAFLNRLGILFYMKGYGQLFERLGGIELPFGEKYGDLLLQYGKKGGANLLVNIPLGRAAATWAASVMSEYNPETSPQDEIERAAAIMTVMGPEALRNRNVSRVFNENLDVETRLEQVHIDFINNWGPISIGFYCDEKLDCISSGISRALKKIGLKDNPRMLDATLDIMLRPRRMGADGQLLPPEDQ